MRKVRVITTGGTIGSILEPKSVTIDLTEKRISNEIMLAKKKLGILVTVDSPVNKNSENLLPTDWVKILTAIKSANDGDSDGIVVTHGTDTLVFSVSAALALRNQWTKKICFTGSYYAPDHPLSDTSLSLLSSLEFSAMMHPAEGVYVAFRSNRFNSEARIIHAANLKPMVFDDLFFESIYNESVSTFTPNQGADDISLTAANSPCLGGERLPDAESVYEASRKVGLISLYPGIDKRMLEAVASGREILVIQAYHSGTGPADIENSDLLDFIRSTDKKIMIATFPQRHIDIPYKSTLLLKEAGAFIYADLQPHFLYVFSLLGLSLSMGVEEIISKMDDYIL